MITEAMLEKAIKAGGDVYTTLAADLYNINKSDVSAEQRQSAKQAAYFALYSFHGKIMKVVK